MTRLDAREDQTGGMPPWEARFTGRNRYLGPVHGREYTIETVRTFQTVETGVVGLYGALFAAYPEGAPGPRPGSDHPGIREVLEWLAAHGPAGGTPQPTPPGGTP